MAKKDDCATPDCEDPAVCAGLCGACYNWHWRRNQAGVKADQQYRKKMKRINNRIDARAPPKRAQLAQRSRARGEARAGMH